MPISISFVFLRPGDGERSTGRAATNKNAYSTDQSPPFLVADLFWYNLEIIGIPTWN
jgi:hypothetical protein